MVVDNRRSRSTDGQPGTDRADRGQVILIGAIALAFIILGVVVVFNGVIYTETLSSGDTGQSASTAETTELEIKQGIGCILENNDPVDNSQDDIIEFKNTYRNATAESRPAVVDIQIVDDQLDVTPLWVDIRISYHSHDFSYEKERHITPDDCPSNS